MKSFLAFILLACTAAARIVPDIYYRDPFSSINAA